MTITTSSEYSATAISTEIGTKLPNTLPRPVREFRKYTHTHNDRDPNGGTFLATDGNSTTIHANVRTRHYEIGIEVFPERSAARPGKTRTGQHKPLVLPRTFVILTVIVTSRARSVGVRDSAPSCFVSVDVGAFVGANAPPAVTICLLSLRASRKISGTRPNEQRRVNGTRVFSRGFPRLEKRTVRGNPSGRTVFAGKDSTVRFARVATGTRAVNTPRRVTVRSEKRTAAYFI